MTYSRQVSERPTLLKSGHPEEERAAASVISHANDQVKARSVLFYGHAGGAAPPWNRYATK